MSGLKPSLYYHMGSISMSQQLGNEVERQVKANKSTTPRTAQRKEEELPWVGLEPTTLCSLGEHSTNLSYQGNSAHVSLMVYVLLLDTWPVCEAT